MSRTARTPERCAATLSRELAEAKRDRRSTIRTYIGTLVGDSGWKKRSAPRMTHLKKAFEDEGLTTNVDITDLALNLETWVRIARSPFWRPPVVGQFSDEENLNGYLQVHHVDTFAGITGLDGLQLIGSEVHVEYDGEERSVDLVFKDPNGTTVIVELEKGDPPDDSVMQLKGYLNAYHQQGETPLRGVLVTGVPRSLQHELDILDALDGLRVDYPVDWYQYRLGVTLERID